MASVIVQLEDSVEVTLTKIDEGVRMSEVMEQGMNSSLEVYIDMTVTLDEEHEGYVEASIQRGNTPEFARFYSIWHSHTFDIITPFSEELVNEFDDHFETFERIAYELWKTNSRLVDGDQFIIGHTDLRCPTLGTAADIPNPVETIMNALLIGRN